MAASFPCVHHVEVGVTDGPRAVHILRNKFTFDVVASRDSKVARQWLLVKSNTRYLVTCLKHGQEEHIQNDDYVIDWMKVPGRKTTTDTTHVTVTSRERKDSVFNVCLQVDSVDKSLARLEACGVGAFKNLKTISDSFGSVTLCTVKSCVGDVFHTLVEKGDYKGQFLPGFKPVVHCPWRDPTTEGFWTFQCQRDCGFPEGGSSTTSASVGGGTTDICGNNVCDIVDNSVSVRGQTDTKIKTVNDNTFCDLVEQDVVGCNTNVSYSCISKSGGDEMTSRCCISESGGDEMTSCVCVSKSGGEEMTSRCCISESGGEEMTSCVCVSEDRRSDQTLLRVRGDQNGVCPVWTTFDHVAFAVEMGTAAHVIGWYEKCLGMKRFMINSDEDKDDGLVLSTDDVSLRLRAMEYWKCAETGLVNPLEGADGHRLSMVIAEGLPPRPGVEEENQIESWLKQHGGPGIQHIALTTDDIKMTVGQLKRQGAAFANAPPPAYYSEVGRLYDIERTGEDLETLRQHGILIDTEADGFRDGRGTTNDGSRDTNIPKERYLLQIFTKPVFPKDPFFMEIIQREGATGFGSGNVAALYRSVQSCIIDKARDI